MTVFRPRARGVDGAFPMFRAPVSLPCAGTPHHSDLLPLPFPVRQPYSVLLFRGCSKRLYDKAAGRGTTEA